jgi:hypothetical protein
MEETGVLGEAAAEQQEPAEEEVQAARNEEDRAAHDETEYQAQLSEEELNAMVEQLCESKAEEFRMIGYENVSGQDIWECVSDKYHKTGFPPLYAVVNDILSLKITQFMNHITLNMYRGETRK